MMASNLYQNFKKKLIWQNQEKESQKEARIEENGYYTR